MRSVRRGDGDEVPVREISAWTLTPKGGWEALRSAPRVAPRTTRELLEEGIAPPPRDRHPIALERALRELVRGREILFTLVERDLRLRYRQTALGALWAVLQPLLFVAVVTAVVGRIVRVGSEGVPYPPFFY